MTDEEKAGVRLPIVLELLKAHPGMGYARADDIVSEAEILVAFVLRGVATNEPQPISKAA